MKRSSLFSLAACLILTTGIATAEVEVVDFSDLPAGTIATEVFGSGGTGPVLITGLNPRLGVDTNAAVIFDSANPTGEDPDLGAPNETFLVDGVPGPGRGDAGIQGSPFENSVPLGKLLIIAEDVVDGDGDGLVDDPDDMDHRGNLLTTDFSGVGPVSIHNMTLIDVERNEAPATARLFNADDEEIGSISLPATGDNGMVFVDFGATPNVTKMLVSLGGSGAISGFEFEYAPPVIVELPQTATQRPLILLLGMLLIAAGAILRFART